MQEDFWEQVRRSIIGRDATLSTPFGTRRLTYADYTASGRCVSFIEDYLRKLMETYGNTHTEDDATGTLTSEYLRQSETAIKTLVNAGPRHKIISAGAGTTAAVHQLQQILGVYVPPAGKEFFRQILATRLPGRDLEELSEWLLAQRPVVFVGPFEHHSNEVSWRECFAEVVEIDLGADGLLDLDDLARKVDRAEYRDRRRMGAFSAASNVSGVKTPVHEVARILHRNGALALFDYAAAAPYEAIDMNRDEESFFDALYFSPHKLLGGPGSCGILIIHERIYRSDLPPTVGAGGTVDFVSFDAQAYNTDIEVREKAGTPGILQTMRAALALQLKEKLGVARIEARERELVSRARSLLCGHPSIELMGDAEPEHRLPIFSFTIRVGSSWLHPRFVTMLLNDLFGIQSRAGCSCAAPYGHRLLHIDPSKSRRLERSIRCGNIGLKPGWARVNFHFLHTDEEVDFICHAIRFIAESGAAFLPLYSFDIHTGNWRHREAARAAGSFGIEDALRTAAPAPAGAGGGQEEEPDLGALFRSYLEEARARAASLQNQMARQELKTTEKDLIPFVYVEG
jgi:selenocysteine lyase/cysteine desulfurase